MLICVGGNRGQYNVIIISVRAIIAFRKCSVRKVEGVVDANECFFMFNLSTAYYYLYRCTTLHCNNNNILFSFHAYNAHTPSRRSVLHEYWRSAARLVGRMRQRSRGSTEDSCTDKDAAVRATCSWREQRAINIINGAENETLFINTTILYARSTRYNIRRRATAIILCAQYSVAYAIFAKIIRNN